MTHRADPNRGIWNATCEFCGSESRCWLVMVVNRYHWKCVDGCGDHD